MVFKIKKTIFSLIASFILFLRYAFRLFFKPYASLRSISREKDNTQIIIIAFICYFYFLFYAYIRINTFNFFSLLLFSLKLFVVFIITFISVTGFFFVISRADNYKINYSSFLFTFSYSLVPTIIWFYTAVLFYFLSPSSRAHSFFGILFSIVFFVFSIVMLFWKIILVYLSIRFSTGKNFFSIAYFLILFLLWFLPYTLLLYRFKIFRIPFI